MNSEQPDSRIERIPTETSGVLRAIGESIPVSDPSLPPAERAKHEQLRIQQLQDRERFLKRYQVAIMSFLGAILRDRDAVTQVWEDFLDKWLSGKLQTFDPQRFEEEPDSRTASFRKYLKQVLRNDCYKHINRLKKERADGPQRLASHIDIEDELADTAEQQFDRSLRSSILAAAMEEMRHEDSIQFKIVGILTTSATKTDKPPSSRALATRLSEEFPGRSFSESNVRQLKKRAKETFSTKIIEQVAQTIDSNRLSDIESSLQELELYTYCEKALPRSRNS